MENQTSPRLRVLFCNWRDTRNPEGGGSEVYVESVARALAGGGHDVTIFCAAHPNAPISEVREGVRYVRAGTKLGVYREAFRRVRRGDFGELDVIVDVQNGIPFLSKLASPKTPVVVLVHHVHREQWPVVYDPVRARVGWTIESRLAPRVYRKSQYVAVSNATRHELANLGVDAERISVIYNGTEPAMPTEISREDTPRILVLGRLVPHKRVEHVLAAAAVLRHEIDGLTVAVVGDGWWSEDLRAEAARLGVDDIVEFTGFVDEAEKHAQLERAWVMALPSLKEGWGIVVMEAAAHEVPTVAYAEAGGVTESVVDGETGILVHGGPDAFTDALRHLLTDATERLRMGQHAAERAATFGWAATGEQFAKVLADAVAQNQSPDSPDPTNPGRRTGVPVPRVRISRPARVRHDRWP